MLLLWHTLFAAALASVQSPAHSLEVTPAKVYPRPVSILFIAHDAGESYMAAPPLLLLADQGFNVTVLALGEPSSTIFLGNATGLNAVGLGDLGVDYAVLDGTRRARAQLLPRGDLATVVSALGTEHMVVVTGAVYAMQAQLSAALSEDLGAYVVALDDSFSLWDNRSLAARLFVQTNIADEIFVTATSIAAGADSFSSGGTLATVTGSPTLDAWSDDAANSSQVLRLKCIVTCGGGGQIASHWNVRVSGLCNACIFGREVRRS